MRSRETKDAGKHATNHFFNRYFTVISRNSRQKIAIALLGGGKARAPAHLLFHHRFVQIRTCLERKPAAGEKYEPMVLQTRFSAARVEGALAWERPIARAPWRTQPATRCNERQTWSQNSKIWLGGDKIDSERYVIERSMDLDYAKKLSMSPHSKTTSEILHQ